MPLQREAYEAAQKSRLIVSLNKCDDTCWWCRGIKFQKTRARVRFTDCNNGHVLHQKCAEMMFHRHPHVNACPECSSSHGDETANDATRYASDVEDDDGDESNDTGTEASVDESTTGSSLGVRDPSVPAPIPVSQAPIPMSPVRVPAPARAPAAASSTHSPVKRKQSLPHRSAAVMVKRPKYSEAGDDDEDPDIWLKFKGDIIQQQSGKSGGYQYLKVWVKKK